MDGIVITFVDITARKLAEEKLRSLTQTLEERVEERTREVRELATTLASAEHRERRRLSQLLHDDLQQLLYGIHMKLSMARDQAESDDYQGLVDQTNRAIALLGDAIAKSRQLSVDLSPPVLEGEGLVDSLQWLQAQMRDLYELDVEIRADAVTVEVEELRGLLFQVVRELLFNVAKHAAKKEARVDVRQRDGQVEIVVSDDGRGFDPAVLSWTADEIAGFGLFNAKERLRMQGGDLKVESSPGEGTTITVQAPLLSG